MSKDSFEIIREAAQAAELQEELIKTFLEMQTEAIRSGKTHKNKFHDHKGLVYEVSIKRIKK